MPGIHRNKLMVITALAAMVLTGIAARNTEETAAYQEGFKNLTVLPKDISRDSMKIVMDGFKDALGVKCGFCHAPQKDNPGKMDFASDEKPEKDIARHMIRMTRDINEIFFNFNNSPRPDTIRSVTCITCHRGDPHPIKK